MFIVASKNGMKETQLYLVRGQCQANSDTRMPSLVGDGQIINHCTINRFPCKMEVFDSLNELNS